MAGLHLNGLDEHIVAEFIKIVDNYVESHYTAREQKLVAIGN